VACLRSGGERASEEKLVERPRAMTQGSLGRFTAPVNYGQQGGRA